MTPKEKAIELVTNYSFFVGSESEIKKCALIAVDEIISAMNDLEDVSINLDGSFTWQNAIDDWWALVKQEIENL
jgi:hypothetical protein